MFESPIRLSVEEVVKRIAMGSPLSLILYLMLTLVAEKN